jgi:putative tryptophan/tyrosine transport system substrate-binding protein
MQLLALPKRLLVLIFMLMHLGFGVATEAAAREFGIIRVAILGPAEEPRFSQMADGFRRGLRDQGYAEANIDIVEQKVARGDMDATRRAVKGIAQQRVAAVFVIGSEIARVVRDSAPDLQTVFVTPGDPVAVGLAASLARPGGNATALTFEFPELSGKRIELLKGFKPKVRQVLALYDPGDSSPRQGIEYAREAARALGISLIERKVRNKTELDDALAILSEADGLVAIPGGAPSAYYSQIIEAANTHKVATLFPSRTAATVNALATYGSQDEDVARDAARLVDKIIKGERAGELPIERPTKLKFSVNLKTARVIGIEVPALLIARADEVIE